ncbi:FecR family protein [Denitratisoma sp. agr-D3]
MATQTARQEDEQPVSSKVLDDAIAWQLRLDADSTEHLPGLQRWLDAHADHARAWRQLGMIDARLQSLPQAPALRQVLLKPRRNRVKPLATVASMLLLAAIGLGAVDRFQPLSGLLADYRTGTGEQRRVVLPDQTVIVLNTRSAVDLQFTPSRRALRLLSGEIQVETGHGDPRPFVVLTEDGSLRALGTRFLTRRDEQGTMITVTESAVLARPRACNDAVDSPCREEQRVTAGSSLRLGPQGLGEIQPARPEADAWVSGMLAVENMPLDELVKELARYRPGYLSVATTLAQLRVTGTVPLGNTDYAIASLTQVLPVRLTRRGNLWLRIEERQEP